MLGEQRDPANDPDRDPVCIVVTGVMAAGKSTVAEALAATYPRCAHVRGDVFRRFIVTGRDPMASPLGDEARRQHELRVALAAHAANTYRAAGFSVVLQDLYVGPVLDLVVGLLDAAPLHVVVLAPSSDVVAQRERARGKTGYQGGWTVEGMCEEFERTTPRRGLWLDTSELTVDDTVAEIQRRLDEARVR